MRACCVGRRGDDDPDGQDSCVGRFWLPRNGAAASPGVVDQSDEEAQEARSAEAVERHTRALGSDPNLLVYMVSDPPAEDPKQQWQRAPKATAQPAPKKQRAHHIPPNTIEGVPIETECFVGKVLVLYKPDAGFGGSGSYHPYQRYFTKHRRAWEFRVQGRFKRVPEGDMYIGMVQKDFNYDQAVAAHSMILKRAGMALVKYDYYLSWGDRCAASKKPNAELSHLVTNMTAWDQIIVTPKGSAPPPLSCELRGVQGGGLNLERKAMGLAGYTKAIESVCQNINTQDTYTLCFWGISQVVDLLRWNFKIGTTISMARFFQDDPIHVVMYELDPADKAEDGGRHLEPRKRYYLDFMFWSNSVHCPRLPRRYNFTDAPEELEHSSSRCSGDGAFVGGGKRPARHEDDSVPPPGSASGSGHLSLLASWSSRLRWIPDFTCSKAHPAAP
mmetsp:Transcript_58747/g.184411  ORF Transcript_58747/g.184411 Transcript_58747/m.184411 type:complete len:444 (+) Transcript_58747:95-1426(+)